MKAIASGALVAVLGVSCAVAESITRDPLAPLAAPPRALPAPVKPVTETLWGKQVTDNYRYMEALDPQTIAWMKAQSAYTRSILDAIHPRAALEAKIAAFTGSFGLTRGYANYGGQRWETPCHQLFPRFARRQQSRGRHLARRLGGCVDLRV